MLTNMVRTLYYKPKSSGTWSVDRCLFCNKIVWEVSSLQPMSWSTGLVTLLESNKSSKFLFWDGKVSEKNTSQITRARSDFLYLFEVLWTLCASSFVATPKERNHFSLNVRSKKTWVGCGRTWVTSEPWPQPIKHLREELGQRPWVRFSCPASIIDLINALQKETSNSSCWCYG